MREICIHVVVKLEISDIKEEQTSIYKFADANMGNYRYTVKLAHATGDVFSATFVLSDRLKVPPIDFTI